MSTTKEYGTRHPALAVMDEDNRLFNQACRAITFTDRIIIGGKDDYARIIDGQPVSDQLSMEGFCRLNDFYYLFRVCHDLRQVLETYIILESYSYTSAAKNALFYLPKVGNTRSVHANQLLSLVDGGAIDEITHLDISQYNLLKETIRYGAYLERVQHNAYTEYESFTDSVQHILLAAAISLFAASGDGEAFDGNPRLTESIFSSIHTYIMKRHNPVMAAQLYTLIHSD